MALKSSRFKNNARLQAAAKSSPAMRAFETNHEAVKILQRALRDLKSAKVGSLPRSFKTGAPDGIYGHETVEAVRNFQKLHPPLKKDGIAGKNTLAKLDEIYFKPPKPVIPVTPPPLVTAPTIDDIKNFMRLRRRVDFASELVPGAGHHLVIFGEVHHASERKGRLVSELLDKNKQYNNHAKYFFSSEVIYPNQISHIQRYLNESDQSKRDQILLSMPGSGQGRAKKYKTAYNTIAEFPHRAAHVLAGGAQQSDLNKRHESIFKSFISSANDAQINFGNSFGYYIIGSAHGARTNTLTKLDGKTVTQRLIGANWKVHVVRLIVDKFFHDKDTDHLTAIDESGGDFDLQDILTSFSQNDAAYYDIRGAHSPFGKLTLAGPGKVKKPYNQFFDAILFYPGY